MSKLNLEDFKSQTWRRLTQLLEQRVEELRELNDNPSFGPEKTAHIRGGISELKRILSLADEASLGSALDPDELAGVQASGLQ